MRDLTNTEIKRELFFKSLDIPYALIGITQTGLTKHILDATQPIRQFLDRCDVHNFDTQGYGDDYRVYINTYLYTKTNVIETQTSLYRANKRGDFRMWVTDIEKLAQADDVLLFFGRGERLNVINLSETDIQNLYNEPRENIIKNLLLEYKGIKVWYEAYDYIADKLNEFYSIHKNNSSKKLLEKLFDTEYGNDNDWLRNSKTKFNATGIDPIQIYASFNNSNSKDSTRIKRIKLLLKEFGSTKEIVPTTYFFTGCPTPIIAQVINSRDDIFQNQIWSVFNSVTTNGKNGLLKKHFELIENWYGIDIASFTIFLFWIDSDNFLPLDENTRSYLVGLRIINQVPRNYSSYIELCELNNKTGIYREIVRAAYELNVKQNSRFIVSKETDDFLRKNTKDTTLKTKKEREEKLESLLHNFRLIAIKPTRKDQKHIKNLELELFKFYQSYQFIDGKDNVIKYAYGVDDEIYNINDRSVSVSAVVGKNGSGKSTISELLFLAINKLSYHYGVNDELENEEVFVNIYFITDTLYKLSLGEEIVLNEYQYDGDTKTYSKSNKNSISQFDINRFFYTIAVNYSLYGLNTRIIDKWIRPLFHKNDSYQMPIVLNPKRDEGNINVNTEESLAKSRLLAFILDWNRLIHKDNEVIIPELVEGKIPHYLSIDFDYEKLERNRAFFKAYDFDQEKVLDDFFQLIKLGDVKAEKYEDEVKEYIFYKLVSISNTYYKTYGDYVKIDEENKIIEFNDIENYVTDLLNDTSHITFKLRQSINYLKHNHIKFDQAESYGMKVIQLSEIINNLQKSEFEKGENSQKRRPETIELIPPSIFKTDIIFSNDSHFQNMSSGEKQSIFAINTVAYHIYNINSVSENEQLKKYNYVNIIFDEVELYFHPDMQRTFIYNMLRYLEQIPLSNILGYNFLFITHSPFILSDISSMNILRMSEGGIETENQFSETFGANIHDLLANDFFLKNGFMGEFSKKFIEKLASDIISENISESKSRDLYSKIALIGEPIIRERLEFMLNEKLMLKSKDDIISELREENKRLREGT